MKLLIIGIDAGESNIFRSMKMPYLNGLMDDLGSLKITEDLWSRGWAEMLTGFDGKENGGFYEKPVLDGTHNFTQKFNSLSYDENAKVVPLWNMLNNLGLKVGFMNVPTTSPAPEVNGFFIGGAGGGLSANPKSPIPKGLCYPEKEVATDLIESGYVFDIRFMASGIKEMDKWFSSLREMIEKRTKTFIRLSKKHEPDFGFIAYMGTQREQYLAMSEIKALISQGGKPTTNHQERILSLFDRFDNSLKELLEEIKPQKIMIVSDHGMVPRSYTMNVNPFLKKVGLQYPTKNKIQYYFKKEAKKIALKILPRDFLVKIYKKNPKLGKSVVESRDIDFDSSKVFGSRYISGFYVNDNRFGGPIKTQDQYKDCVAETIKAFNETNEAKDHKLVAKKYRSCFEESKFQDLLPDIWIDHPDYIVFNSDGGFLERNKDYKLIDGLEKVNRDANTGAKGMHPLFYYSKELEEYIYEEDEKNLTLTYKVVERYFNDK